MRAAELSIGKDSMTLAKFGQVALVEGAVRDGEVVDVDTVAAAIRQLWSHTRFSSKKVVIGVANSKVIVRQVDLQLGVAGVFAVRVAGHHVLQRVERKLCHLLVAADVGDLLVVAQRFEVVGVDGVATAGMELGEAVERDDGLVVLGAFVKGVGRHQLRLVGPDRVGVLAVDLLELELRGLVVALLQRVDIVVKRGIRYR